MITANSPKPLPEKPGSVIESHGTKVFIRPRQGEVARDAVAHAQFNEKKWVWVEDWQRREFQGYVKAFVVKDVSPTGEIEVELEHGQKLVLSEDKAHPMNPPKFDMVHDMAELTHLNEPSVIHNLTVRYKANQIYTYSGLFLVAVNPYRNLSIYTEEQIRKYKGRRRGEIPPHIYTVADQAYRDMVHERKNQSILITGESGAGKTENTKIVIEYLTAVASGRRQSTEEASRLQQQILRANPILESFGNAQTIRNNNSSRFGKFIRIEFNTRAQICGANIEWYLLEKSRVHRQTSSERNYHIFYQLLSADDVVKEKLLLQNGRPSDYRFTQQSNFKIEGVDDAKEFRALMDSLDVMGLTSVEIDNLLLIVAAVLHLGNIEVTSEFRGERADISDISAVERVCHLLGISEPHEFKKGLLSPRIKAGRDWVNQAKTRDQVMASLDALAKVLYERNFASLVGRVNHAIDGQKSFDKIGFIGVLDIAGFEIFEINSFEQLCINYTNEKLQQFFNHNMFVLEQEEYQKEKIDWQYIDFGRDLQPTIDLIEKTNPVGILSCLEEECVAPQGTDKRFLEKLNRVWDNEEPDNKFRNTRFGDGFIVMHYAGNVEYSTTGWIDKNKDPLNEDVTRLLARSKNAYIAKMFSDYLYDDNEVDYRSNPKMRKGELRKGGGSFRTVGQRHKQQLLTLMNTLDLTHPHFVRCIIPNNRKRAGEIQDKLVLDQLRCNGVLEGIRICRKGYPNRLSFTDFRKRYEILCPNSLTPNRFIDGRSACQTLLDGIKLGKEKYRVGTTKIFFKATVLGELEEIRDRKLAEYIIGFQALCRRRLAQHRQERTRKQTAAIKIIQQNARQYVALREWQWWRLYSKLKPLIPAYRADVEIKKRDNKIKELDNSLNDVRKKNDDLKKQNDELASDMKEQEMFAIELKDTNLNLQEQLKNDKERIDEIENERTEQACMIARLREELKDSDRVNKDLGDELNTKNKRISELEDEFSSLKNESTSMKEKYEDELAQRASTTQSEVDALHDEMEKHKADLDASRRELDKERAWRQKLQETNDQLVSLLRLEADAKIKQAEELNDMLGKLKKADESYN